MNKMLTLNNCLCCKNEDVRTILDLGLQPLANSYCKNKNDLEEKFPLKLNLCLKCFHMQLSHKVNPNLMFKNYLYVSGTTKTLRDYFDFFAKTACEIHGNAKNVLDIACNDGSQLDSFKKLGVETFGVDPAENLYELSSKNHNIICDYFNNKTAKQINRKFSIITAQNVFAHTSNVDEFLTCCKKLMDSNSFLFIQTSQCEMVKSNQFDTVYHEHISFFNINSMQTLLNRNDLYLYDVRKVSVHGNSYVFIITKDKSKENLNIKMFEDEKNDKLLDPMTYYKYALECQNVVYNLKSNINKYLKDDFLIVGYGAAAKGNTLLNFGKIDLDYIIDDNPLKQNLYTPGQKIKIISIENLKEISENKKILIIPLAWNYYEEIKKRIVIANIKENCKFLYMLNYFPKVLEEVL